jgi:hypothetical protein
VAGAYPVRFLSVLTEAFNTIINAGYPGMVESGRRTPPPRAFIGVWPERGIFAHSNTSGAGKTWGRVAQGNFTPGLPQILA